MEYQLDLYNFKAGRGPDPKQLRLDRELENYKAKAAAQKKESVQTTTTTTTTTATTEEETPTTEA